MAAHLATLLLVGPLRSSTGSLSAAAIDGRTEARISLRPSALRRMWPRCWSGGPTRPGIEDDHPVWDDGLVGNETGPLIYFGVRWDVAEEVSTFAAQVATPMGLVCFDVSRGKLLS